MSLILSIETATSVCSVALHKQHDLIGLQELHLEKSHSGLLAVLIQDLVKYCGYTMDDLDAVAVSKGPGSYTGLRIGTATAKGLCYALDIPMLAINTLEAMAHKANQFNYQGDYLCPMIDARRMEVYCLIVNDELETIEATRPVIVDEDAFRKYLDERTMIFFGNGAAKCKPLLSPFPRAVFIDNIFPSAKEIGELAATKMDENKEGAFEDIAYFEPFYLKDFKAISPKTKNL